MATYNYPTDFSGTQWLIVDGDIYVSSIGDDGTGDGSPSAPYATIQHAITQATTGQRVVVGAGNYLETLDGGSKSLALVADGLVVLQGNDTGPAISSWGNAATSSITAVKFECYTNAIEGEVGLVERCEVVDCDISGFGGTINGSLLKGATLNATVDTNLINCTLIGVAANASDNRFVDVVDCHFDSTTTIDLETMILNSFDSCNQEAGSSVVIDAVAYNTAAAVNAAHAAYQANGLSVAPQFSNTAGDDYTLKDGSPLANAGSKGHQVGAYGRSFSQYKATMQGMTLSNVYTDANNFFRLVDGQQLGTIQSPVVDFGRVELLGKIRLFAEQQFATPPNNAVVDQLSTAATPNIISFAMRHSKTNEGLERSKYRVYIWNKAPQVDGNGRGNADPQFDISSARTISAQFVQFQITLRDELCNVQLEDGDALLLENGCKLLLEDCD